MGREPIYLTVGTEVSAKYRGAFCEATVKEVKRLVKVRATLRDGKGSVTVTHDHLKLSSGSSLALGKTVEVKGTDGQYTEAVVAKITDASVYTVVFDDGDEKSLRRTSLCLKGEKHFNESETLDHLPLTDPENFGTPVQPSSGKVKPRKRGHSGNSLSGEDGDGDEETRMGSRKRPRRSGDPSLGKVILVESSERRKTFWTPAVVLPSLSAPSGIDVAPDQVLARQFRDGKFVVVQRDGLRLFAKDADLAFRSETSVLGQKSALQQALAYSETGELPWNPVESHEEGDSTDDDKGGSESQTASPALGEGCGDFPEDGPEVPSRELFQKKYSKFLEDQGSPMKTIPSVAGRSLDLYQLILLVRHHKGPDETIKQASWWREICSKLNILPATSAIAQSLKTAYEKHLAAFERSSWDGSGVDLGMEDEDEETALGEEEEQSLGEECDEEEMQVEHDTRKDLSGPAVGDKIMVRYGRGRNQKHYAAKVVDIERDGNDIHYFIHYAGWNNRYDEWISPDRIVEKGPVRSRAPSALKGKSRSNIRSAATNKGISNRIIQQSSAVRSNRRGDQSQRNSSATLEMQPMSIATTNRPSLLEEDTAGGNKKGLSASERGQPSPSPEPLVRTVPLHATHTKQPVISSSEEEGEEIGTGSGEGTVTSSPDVEGATDGTSGWQHIIDEENGSRSSEDVATDENMFLSGENKEEEKHEEEMSDNAEGDEGPGQKGVEEDVEEQLADRTAEEEIDEAESGMEASNPSDEDLHSDEAGEGSLDVESDDEEEMESETNRRDNDKQRSVGGESTEEELGDEEPVEDETTEQEERTSSREEDQITKEKEEEDEEEECAETEGLTGAEIVQSEEDTLDLGVDKVSHQGVQPLDEVAGSDEDEQVLSDCDSESDKVVKSQEDVAELSKDVLSAQPLPSSPEFAVPSDDDDDEEQIEEALDNVAMMDEAPEPVGDEQTEAGNECSVEVSKSLVIQSNFSEDLHRETLDTEDQRVRAVTPSFSSEDESPNAQLIMDTQCSVSSQVPTIVPKSASGCERYCHVQWVVNLTNSDLDTSQKIGVVQRRISDIRRVYSELRSELATIDRRLKRARRRERERESENSCAQTGD